MAHLGIDIGTQSLKVALIDDEFGFLGQGSEGYVVSHPRAGYSEQDPQVWERALPVAIARACKAVGVKSTAIRSIGVAGQLDGAIAVDTAGNPQSNCLIWMDRRATSFVPDISVDQFRKKTGQVPDASHMGPKIAWLKQNVDLPKGSRFHQPVSWLVERLTGNFCLDPMLASSTMMFSLVDGGWDPELTALFTTSVTELPAIENAENLAGVLSASAARWTGLPAGIPVAVGTGDDFATPLGAGVGSPGEAVVVLGTAEVVGVVSETMKLDEAGLVETHPYVGNQYWLENPGWLSGGALTWLVELLNFKSFDELFSVATASAIGADGLTFIPALTGSLAPEWNADARGCFYGLTPSHGKAEMARAVLEACVFAMRDVVFRLKELELKTTNLRLLGGGARSSLWSQMRADVSGIPARADLNVDTCAVGAAILGAVAANERLEVTDVVASLKIDCLEFEPSQANKNAYDAAYSRYLELFEVLKPLF